MKSIDNRFKSFVRCDSRIEIDLEKRKRATGFAGVAFLFRKTLNATPLVDEGNDRVIVLSVSMQDHSELFIIGVLLPSTNVNISDFSNTIEIVSGIYDRFSSDGVVIIVGDLNAQLSRAFGQKNHMKANDRGKLIEEFMSNRCLYSVNS